MFHLIFTILLRTYVIIGTRKGNNTVGLDNRSPAQTRVRTYKIEPHVRGNTPIRVSRISLGAGNFEIPFEKQQFVVSTCSKSNGTTHDPGHRQFRHCFCVFDDLFRVFLATAIESANRVTRNVKKFTRTTTETFRKSKPAHGERVL